MSAFAAGQIVRYTQTACEGKQSPERAAQDRGLCVSLESTIAWVIWDHTYAPIWEIASELERAQAGPDDEQREFLRKVYEHHRRKIHEQ